MSLSPVVGVFDVNLRSSALLDWTANATLVARREQAGTVSRSTIGTGIDSGGRVYRALANQPRWRASLEDGSLGLLVEPTSTNLVLQSEHYATTWTAVNSPGITSGAHTASGVSLDLLSDTSTTARAAYEQTVTFTGDGVKALSFFIKQRTATASLLYAIDASTGVTLLDAVVTWDASGFPLVTTTAGAGLAAQRLADGVYRLWCQTASVTAAHNVTIGVSPAASALSDSVSTGSLYVGGAQAENVPSPTSYIKTTTTAGTRATETIHFPIAFPPQELTVLGLIEWFGSRTPFTMAELTGSVAHGVFSLGDDFVGVGNEAFLLDIFTTSGQTLARLRHLVNGVGATVSVPIGSFISPIEYSAYLAVDGSVALTMVDGAGAVALGTSL
jgi:hypothetical protein